MKAILLLKRQWQFKEIMTPIQLLQTVPRKVDAILKTLDEQSGNKFGTLEIDFDNFEKMIRVIDKDTEFFHTLYFIGDPNDAQSIFFENPGFEDMTVSLDGFVHFEKLIYTELSTLQAEILDMPEAVSSMGFFRHIRPIVYDAVSHTMSRHPKGGVSIYIAPIADRSYDYWIYVCPLDTRFSARQAVHSLRQTSLEATPWGNISLGDEESIVNKLISSMGAASELPSDIPNMVKAILAGNEIEIQAMKDAEAVITKANNVYEKIDTIDTASIIHYDEFSETRPVGHGFKTIFPPSK